MTEIKHGTTAAYNRHGCRCEPCREAVSRYHKQWRVRAYAAGGHTKRDSTGTLRRLEALQALGWTYRDIAQASGLSVTALSKMLYYRTSVVYEHTANGVARAYAALSSRRGTNKSVASHARNRGYAPPAAWDDIDDPAESPEGVPA